MTTIPRVDEIRLVALLQNPTTTSQEWTGRAACTGQAMAPDCYFPEEDHPPSVKALACCAACPVSHECLATAMVHEAIDGYRFGWWGGVGPVERDLLWAALDLPTSDPIAAGLRNPAAIARYLRTQRRTVTAIAAELGCTERTVYRYLAASAA